MASDIYDSCGRLQSSGVQYLNSSCSRAYSGLTVVFDFPFLEGTRLIANVSVVNNTFAAVGYPPAQTMGEILTADPDVENLVVYGNTVQTD